MKHDWSYTIESLVYILCLIAIVVVPVFFPEVIDRILRGWGNLAAGQF